MVLLRSAWRFLWQVCGRGAAQCSRIIFLVFGSAVIKKPHSGYSTIFHVFAAAVEKGSIRSAAFFIGMGISFRLLID